MSAIADAQARAQARADAGRARKDAQRAADVEMAAWVDGMRSRFGATLTRVEWPDGRTWGEADKGRWMTADEWLDYVNDTNPRPLWVA